MICHNNNKDYYYGMHKLSQIENSYLVNRQRKGSPSETCANVGGFLYGNLKVGL
jgi:hypothetical protein